MNSEKAALKHVLDHQVSPTPDNWSDILEALDREEISNMLHARTENPSSNWATIEARLEKKEHIQPKWVAAITLGLFLIIAYWQYSPSPAASETVLVNLPLDKSPTNGSSGFTAPDESVKINTATTQTEVTLDPAPSYINRSPHTGDMNYLLVAKEDGKPIRVPVKWSALSCCLSGEMETIDCKEQQNAWHTELATSGLGFQADPILGLMELIAATDDR